MKIRFRIQNLKDDIKQKLVLACNSQQNSFKMRERFAFLHQFKLLKRFTFLIG